MGGISSRLRRMMSNDAFVGRTVYVHGVPYTFDGRLGVGAFGTVYSATSPSGTPVAIKMINLNGLPPLRAQALVSTYLNEVALLERLRKQSHHVVVIHDFDFDERYGIAYIVMELGQENLFKLISRLRSHGPHMGPFIDPHTIKELWRQMVSIVHALHAQNIVHMDLKPDNLILFGSLLKIVDLGISRKANAVGRGGMGTRFFSAPEIMEDIPGVQRLYGPKADVWSLGAILYFMVYGRPPSYHPFAANPPPGLPPHPDPSLNDLLRRTLVRNPNVRASIYEVLAHPYTRM